MEAAYELFAAKGVARVGVDAILARADCAKASLYSHFKSKVDLAIAVLDRRETLWTRGWLEASIRSGERGPKERLLGIFDTFETWFRTRSFEGCPFVNVLLESERGSPLHRAAAAHLATIRGMIVELAEQAGLRQPEKFAHAMHMLMKGSIIAAAEGNRNAARDAKRAARLIIDHWERAAERH
jgi:AcrR family transcriptional regulator